MDCYKLLAAALIASAPLTTKGVVINEVMQSCVYLIMDDLNDFPDSWVEFYNDSDKDINLNGYKIGLTNDHTQAYVLPNHNVRAGKTTLVYCDKAAQGMHTDFRVDSGKGEVYLFDKDGNVIDRLTLKKQPSPEVGYGRLSDGDSKWGYELKPTPGAANEGGHSDVVLGAVKFDTPGGVWAQKHAISLELGLPDKAPEGTYIIYTTNGSEPTAESATRYENPLTITDGCVVRAKAVCEGCISVPSNAESYIFLDRAVKIPVVSIAINDEYLNDTKIGIFSKGEKYQENNDPWGWPWGGGNNNWDEERDANYFKDWRRPCNIQYFPAEGEPSVINQLGETRVQGGYTRRNNLKSMAVYANKRFGTKRFSYEFWPKDKPGVSDNKSFILRNGGNDFGIAYVRDGLMQRIIGRNTDIDWQGYQPVIVCINGKYHAMLALRERSSEDNIYSNYKGLEDIDMFENWEELKAGDAEAINEFKDFIDNWHDFDEWDEYINLESYTNLMALNYWIYNTDFPHNNVVMWRRTDGGDERWRWLVKDCDFGLGIYSANDVNSDFAKWLNNNPDHQEATGYNLWRQLMKCQSYQDYFVDHLIVYCGDFLNAETFYAYLDEIVDDSQGELLISNNQWSSGWWGPADLSGNLRGMRDWIEKRQKNIKGIIRKGFDLGSNVEVTVNQGLTAEQLAGITVYYDEIPLTKGTFNGTDYEGRTITLRGDDASHIVGWSVKVGADEITIDSPELEYDIEGTQAIAINAIIDPSGITDITADGELNIHQRGGQIYSESAVDVYDLSGRQIAGGMRNVKLPGHGIYVVKTAAGQAAKVVY